jgi:hypothetical protein
MSLADDAIVFLGSQPYLSPCAVAACLLAPGCDPAGMLRLYGLLLSKHGFIPDGPLSSEKALQVSQREPTKPPWKHVTGGCIGEPHPQSRHTPPGARGLQSLYGVAGRSC